MTIVRFPVRQALHACGLCLLATQVHAQQADASLRPITVTADALDLDDTRPFTVSTATKMALDIKDVPQTVESLEVSKFKVYGINDLSVLLDGVPGVDTSYDMRGDGVMIRGFSADSNDIYRDGVRASGQIRRSTANVERIEVVKGPASVLYGRGLGGGMVNMISKQANFTSPSSVGIRAGSHGNRGANVDINHVVSPNFAVRLTADYEEADSFRRGISNENKMVSPSLIYDNQNGFSWLLQYTWDKVWRIPDRAPAFDNLPAGVSYRTAYAHPDDFVEDEMKMARSVLSYRLNDQWSLKWTLAHHDANQDFDHLYAGSYCQPDGTRLSTGARCTTPGLMTFTTAWQVTNNQTLSNVLDLSGKFSTGSWQHDLLVGVELADEKRRPDLSTSGSDPAILYPYGIDPFNPVWTQPKAVHGAPATSNRHEAQAQAIYVQDLISVSEQWKLLLGARFDRFEFKSHNLISGQRRSYDGDTISPRAGVLWQPLAQHSFYASFSKNFAPYGGRTLMSVAVAEDAVYDDEPQYSDQYEVGMKSEWLEGNLSSQLSVYTLELNNIRYRPDPDNDPYRWAVRGQERSRGVELSVAGKLGESWYVRSGLGVLEAKVVKDVTTPASVGKYKQGTAKVTGNLFLRYAPEGSDWYGESGVTFRDSVYNNLANTSERASYGRWDASVGWRPMPWVVTAAVTNIADRRYWRSTSMPGAPRSFLVNASYVFR